jgi:hypothetical protein
VTNTRREYAAATAAQIVNLFAGDYSGNKSELYSQICNLIMEVMYLADEDVAEIWKEPSAN